MERRESRLRRIRERLSSEGRLASEPVARTPLEHHHIGISEKNHENIGHFLRTCTGDPAIQVQIIAVMIAPRLIAHIIELPAQSETTPPSPDSVKSA
jgi:hypothetical protein